MTGARAFIEARRLGLFWCEDLCILPEEGSEGMGVWAKHPINARQAVGLDLRTAQVLVRCVSGPEDSTSITLHELTLWYLRDKRHATSTLERCLPAAAYSHVRMLLDCLTVDENAARMLRSEYRTRDDERRTLRFGASFDKEERVAKER